MSAIFHFMYFMFQVRKMAFLQLKEFLYPQISHFLSFSTIESNSVTSNMVPGRPALQISRVSPLWVNVTREEPKSLPAKVPKASTTQVTPMNGALHFQNAPVTSTNVGLAQCTGHHSHSMFIEQIKEWLLPGKDNRLWLYWLDSMPKMCKYLGHINSFAPTVYDCEVGSQIGYLLMSPS